MRILEVTGDSTHVESSKLRWLTGIAAGQLMDSRYALFYDTNDPRFVRRAWPRGFGSP